MEWLKSISGAAPAHTPYAGGLAPALNDVLAGRNSEANRAIAGMLDEATADMPAEYRDRDFTNRSDIDTRVTPQRVTSRFGDPEVEDVSFYANAGKPIGDGVRGRAMAAKTFAPAVYAGELRRMAQLRASFHAWMAPYDALLTPTLAIRVPAANGPYSLLRDESLDDWVGRLTDACRFTMPANEMCSPMARNASAVAASPVKECITPRTGP